MSNSCCIDVRIFRAAHQSNNFRKKCQVVFLLAWLNGSFTNWGIPAQTGQWNQEKGQGKTDSAETDNFISPAGSEKIDINLASLEELQTLPGIGSVTAKRIVDYRKKNPPFRKVEELLIIRGISKNRLEQIRNRIRVH